MKVVHGFTLSEVLITLGVIAVVSAITLPTVINRISDVILINQAKKAYSNILNILNRMQADYGVSDYAGLFATGETKNQHCQNIAKYYDGAICCENSSSSNICGTYYTVKLKDKSKTEDYGFPRIVNKDGSMIYIRLLNGKSIPNCIADGYQPDNRCLDIVLDVNGQYKKPNQYGADTHQITIYSNRLNAHTYDSYGNLETIFLQNSHLNYTK